MPTQTTTILVMPQQPLSNSESFGSKRDSHSSASPRRKTRHLLCSRYETFCHSETARIDSDPKRRIHRADGMPSLHLRRNLLCVSKIHSFAVRYRAFVDVPKCSASTARASSISGCCILRKYVFRFGCWRLAAGGHTARRELAGRCLTRAHRGAAGGHRRPDCSRDSALSRAQSLTPLVRASMRVGSQRVVRHWHSLRLLRSRRKECERGTAPENLQHLL